MKIKKIIGREILDSRGVPTIEAMVVLENGLWAKAGVPSGASTGEHEAHELRDGDEKRYLGLGVLKAVKNINTKIAPKLVGQEVTKQKVLDEIMINLDGTLNKEKIGANAILAVSMAVARAGAISKKMPLYKYIRWAYKLPEKKWRFPIPTMNIINGGKHADNSITAQEFMIVPMAKNIEKNVRIGAEIFLNLKKILKKAGYQTLVGDEGGFAPNLKTNEEAFDFILLAIKQAGYIAGKEVFCATDVALSEYYDKKTGLYSLNDKSGKKKITAMEVIETMKRWSQKYPLVSIEDPLDENDWENWAKITKVLGKKTIIVGDDLFVTNVARLQKGIEEGIGNAILIKLNQIGTLSETIKTIYLAKKNNYKVSVSHRSGETADTFIADLSVAVQADFIKTGSLSRSERVEKYNRLMEIEKELKKQI